MAEKGGKGGDADEGDNTRDPMFEQAVECVIEAGQASTSLLQRRCKLGYARARPYHGPDGTGRGHRSLRGRQTPFRFGDHGPMAGAQALCRIR